MDIPINVIFLTIWEVSTNLVHKLPLDEFAEFMKVSGNSLSSWRYLWVIRWVHEGIGSFTEYEGIGSFAEFMKVSGPSLSSWRYRVIHWVHEDIGSFTDFDKYGICKVSVPVCHIECLKKNTGQFSGAEPVLILSKSRRFGFPAGRMSSSLASKASLWTGKVKIRKDRLQPKKLKLKKAGLRCTLSNCPVLSDTLSLEDLDSWIRQELDR